MAPGTAPLQRHEQAAQGSQHSAASGGGGEKAETRGPASRPPLRPPLQRRSLEILALAGPAVLEAPGLEDSTGPGRHLRTGGSGGRGLEIREQPRSARRGLPARRVAVRRRWRTRPRQRSAGPGPRGGTVPPVPPRPRGGPSWPQSRAAAVAAPEPQGHGITRPGRGRGVGRAGRGRGRVARSRRARRPGAVIERLAARPSPGCSPPTQPFIHSSVLSPSTHLLPKHVSSLSSVHPIIAPGITLTRQRWLSPLSLPASLSVPLSLAPTSRPPGPLSVWQGGGAHPTTSVTRSLLFSDGQTQSLPTNRPSTKGFVYQGFSPPCRAFAETW